MKTPIEALLVVAALFVQGCITYVPGVEKTDLSAVYEETATRSEIEAVLGEPVAARTTDEGSISIYKYNKGAEGEMSSGASEGLDLSMLGVLGPAGVWASTPFLYANKVDKQRGFLAIIYSADDTPTIMQLSGDDDPDAEVDRLVARLQLKRRAEEGDPDAQWELAKIAPKDQREMWRCLAAHSGNAKAQNLRSNLYEYGRPPLEEDKVQALKWEMLARASGYTRPPPFYNEPKSTMRPEQIAEAEQLFAEWQPNPAGCVVAETSLGD